MLDHVVQGLLGQPVKLLLCLGTEREPVSRAGDGHIDSLPGRHSRGVLGHRGHQPLLGQRAGTQLEDQGPHLGQRPLVELADLGQRPGRGMVLTNAGRAQLRLRGPHLKSHGEQRLGHRVMQVAGEGLPGLGRGHCPGPPEQRHMSERHGDLAGQRLGGGDLLRCIPGRP